MVQAGETMSNASGELYGRSEKSIPRELHVHGDRCRVMVWDYRAVTELRSSDETQFLNAYAPHDRFTQTIRISLFPV